MIETALLTASAFAFAAQWVGIADRASSSSLDTEQTPGVAKTALALGLGDRGDSKCQRIAGTVIARLVRCMLGLVFAGGTSFNAGA